MTLRVRLVLALMTAALLPVAVAVGVPWLRAGGRATEQAGRRRDRALRQAEILVAQVGRDAVSRTERAAFDLGRDRALVDALVAGPEERAMAVARPLAERNGLEPLEIRSASGALLSAFPASSELPASGVPLDGPPQLLPVPGGVGFLVRRSLSSGDEAFVVTGARTIDREAIATIEEITGGPVVLKDADGRALESSGDLALRDSWLTAALPLDAAGRRIEVAVPPADVEQERKDLLRVFAGVAPLALASALCVGLLLAEGISRPIRSLASRAEEIAASREGSFPMMRETNEVRRLTQAFDRMLTALAASEHRRLGAERIAAWQEVARRIAHEVKNPLSPIQLAVENLRRTRIKAPETFDHSLDVETTTILEEVASLKRLVDEFSEFARLPSPRMVGSDLRAIVSQALALFSSRIEASGVEVETSLDGGPARVRCDPEQIGRVLKNVLANALDALEPVADRRLRVTLRSAFAAESPMAELEVSDTGVGLDAEALRRVFEPYFTTRSDRGGTGLGMAIVHRIVSEHGGTVEVRGSAGKGATVTIRIPAEQCPSEEQA